MTMSSFSFDWGRLCCCETRCNIEPQYTSRERSYRCLIGHIFLTIDNEHDDHQTLTQLDAFLFLFLLVDTAYSVALSPLHSFTSTFILLNNTHHTSHILHLINIDCTSIKLLLLLSKGHSTFDDHQNRRRSPCKVRLPCTMPCRYVPRPQQHCRPLQPFRLLQE